jgi:hypothetical protein
VILALLLSAHASVPDLYGFGATGIGRAGAGSAMADDAWAAFYNPAGVARLRRVVLQAGWIGGQADLLSFDRIVYDGDGDGDTFDAAGFAEIGPVGTDYRARAGEDPRQFYTNGMQVAFSVPFLEWFSLALAAYVPAEGLMRLQVQDPAIPYYVMYRNRNNRFALHPALAVQPIPGLSIGGGVSLAIGGRLTAEAVASADITAFPADGGTDLDADIDLAIRRIDGVFQARLAPALGMHLTLGAFVPTAKSRLKEDLDRVALAVSWRGPWRIDVGADIAAGVNGAVTFDDDTVLLQELLEEPLLLSLDDLTAFYNPPTVTVGLSGGHGPIQASFDAKWTGWSGFTELTVPSAAFQIDSIAGTSISVRLAEELPPPAFQDTWSFAGAVDGVAVLKRGLKGVDTIALRARGGYAWVPTPVPPQTGRTNYMDADRHVGALGLGLELGKSPVSKGPLRIDVGVQLHGLVRNTVTKDASLVADVDGDGRLDYPSGWPFDGQLTAGGRTWVVQAGVEGRFGDPVLPRERARDRSRRKGGAG